MSKETFILGSYINQDGQIYSTVYDENMPEEIRLELEGDNMQCDVWNQISFASKEYFESQVKAGSAIK
jgi:hypothetical protein